MILAFDACFVCEFFTKVIIINFVNQHENEQKHKWACLSSNPLQIMQKVAPIILGITYLHGLMVELRMEMPIAVFIS